MATNIDTSRLSGWFKDRFGSDGSMLPDDGYDTLQKRVPFNSSKLLGEKLTQPMRAAHSSGWTFAGGSTTGTMFALNDANSPLTVEASWTSVEFVLREKTSWKAMRAAMSSAQAFGVQYDDMIMDMRKSARLALEFNMLYGGSDLGTIESQTGSSTDRVYTLSLASSTAGLWYKLQGTLFDIYSAYGGTKHNDNEDITVVSADINASSGKVELTVTGDATDLTNIDTDLGTAAVMIPKGADGNMMVGIDAIAVNTGSYAGISAATYPMWKSTSLAASSASATYSKIMQALKRNRLKSGGGKRVCIISDATMTDIADNVTTLQRLDKGGAKATIGPDSVTFTSPGGSVEFVSCLICKEGEAFIVDMGCFERIGSVDFTFDPTGKGNYYEPVAGFAGQEVIGYWDQTIKCDSPASITKITGIVNTF